MKRSRNPHCRSAAPWWIGAGVALLAVAPVVALAQTAGDPPPDAPAVATPPTDQRYELGGRFQSEAAGIAFTGPADCREIRRTGTEQVVQYVNEQRKWSLTVSRAVLGKSVPLTEWTDGEGRRQPGMLEATVEQMKADSPGIEILRQDFINVGSTEVGMIAARVTIGLETRLTQRALVRSSDRLYFSFTFLTPAPREGALEQDPETSRVVDLFNRIIDSVKVLDQSRLMEEQNQRLYRTRALYVNLTEDRLRGVLAPEQWLRLLRDGKDIGYSYVVEEVATDLPRPGIAADANRGGREGVRVGIRSRTYPDAGMQVDAETWLFVTFDRRNEIWSNVGVIQNADKTREEFGEFGSADREVKRVIDPTLAPGERLPDGRVDEKQPPVRATEQYTLSVLRNSKAISGEQIERQLPPFYLPQALAHILPRAAVTDGPKTYLFATWVSDQREVMKRYIDVDAEQLVTLDGKRIAAIPVRDRLGVEGSVTTHYISPTGKYLGSVNPDSNITILATDQATLEKIWSNPDLRRPGEVKGR